MNVEKIVKKTETKKLDFTEITLLSIEEFRSLKDKIPTTKENSWWLRSPGLGDYGAAFVNGDDGDVYVYGYNVILEFGVRPALRISNPESLQTGDKFELADKSWTVISEEYALCDDIIGKSTFREDYEAENPNDYEYSDVKKYVENWAKENSIEFVPELQSEADRTTEEEKIPEENSIPEGGIRNTNQSDKEIAMSQKFTLKIINTCFPNPGNKEVLSVLWVYPPTDIEQVYLHVAEIYKANQYDLGEKFDCIVDARHRLREEHRTRINGTYSLLGCVYYKLYDESGKNVEWADDALTKILEYAKEVNPREILSDEHKFPFEEYVLDRRMSLFEWEAKEDKGVQLWDETAPDINELKKFWREHLETGREGYDNGHEWFAISNLEAKDFERVIRLAKQADEAGNNIRTVNFCISDTGSCYFDANTSKTFDAALRYMVNEGNFHNNPTYYQDYWNEPSAIELSHTDCELTKFGIELYDCEDMEEYIDSYGDVLQYDVCFLVRDNSTRAIFDLGAGCIEKEQVESLLDIANKLPLAADCEITAEDKKTTLGSLQGWMEDKESEFESVLEEYEEEDDE